MGSVLGTVSQALAVNADGNKGAWLRSHGDVSEESNPMRPESSRRIRVFYGYLLQS
jgi:hypothetical protein